MTNGYIKSRFKGKCKMNIIGYYFSFASEEAFLGACQVRGSSLEECWAEVNRLELNPGGQSVAMPLIEEMTTHVHPESWGRLFKSFEEMEPYFGRIIKHSDLNEKERYIIEKHGLFKEQPVKQ